MVKRAHREDGYYWLLPRAATPASSYPRVWQKKDSSHAQIGRYEFFPTNYDGDFPWTIHGVAGILTEEQIRYDFTIGPRIGSLCGPADLLCRRCGQSRQNHVDAVGVARDCVGYTNR